MMHDCKFTSSMSDQPNRVTDSTAGTETLSTTHRDAGQLWQIAAAMQLNDRSQNDPALSSRNICCHKEPS
jgi:hypothetical protein